MVDQIVKFYDSMADSYHLIFEDWNRSIQRQATALGSIISRELSGRPLRILDCACGIGTQSLGLASLGHYVVGCDLSPAAVRRAAREAEQRSLKIEFYVSDMRSLNEISEDGFDVVSAFDNALPHLTSDDLIEAIVAMAGKLKPGGLFLASIRDYDSILAEGPTIQQPAFFGTEGSRRIVHQVWDWIEPARYKLHLFITVQCQQDWKTEHFVSEYRCVTRQELSDSLTSAGFEDPVWLIPEESGYYQPVVIARRA